MSAGVISFFISLLKHENGQRIVKKQKKKKTKYIYNKSMRLSFAWATLNKARDEKKGL